MIRFKLACTHDHEFEGWFKSNAAYDDQVQKGVLECPICADRAIRKAIMAPAIARSASAPAPEILPPLPAQAVAAPPADPRREQFARFMQMMHAVRRHVEDNFENVGGRFPEEARKMHQGETDPREIYGQATRAEVEELLDEGVPIHPLPTLPKLDG